jgi:hypothetical protein
MTAGGLGLMLSTAMVAQTTHLVIGGGLALQAAIQAAAPGETLDVLLSSYAAVTCSKGLRIALQAGAEIGTTFALTRSLVITTGPSQEAGVVTGGKVNGLSVSQCAGTVVVDGVAINAFLQNPPMEVADCAGPIVFDRVDHTTPRGRPTACFR